MTAQSAIVTMKASGHNSSHERLRLFLKGSAFNSLLRGFGRDGRVLPGAAERGPAVWLADGWLNRVAK
jgi:hypothetical protein